MRLCFTIEFHTMKVRFLAFIGLFVVFSFGTFSSPMWACGHGHEKESASKAETKPAKFVEQKNSEKPTCLRCSIKDQSSCCWCGAFGTSDCCGTCGGSGTLCFCGCDDQSPWDRSPQADHTPTRFQEREIIPESLGIKNGNWNFDDPCFVRDRTIFQFRFTPPKYILTHSFLC
jgi:hypothetical protein